MSLCPALINLTSSFGIHLLMTMTFVWNLSDLTLKTLAMTISCLEMSLCSRFACSYRDQGSLAPALNFTDWKELQSLAAFGM